MVLLFDHYYSVGTRRLSLRFGLKDSGCSVCWNCFTFLGPDRKANVSKVERDWQRGVTRY